MKERISDLEKQTVLPQQQPQQPQQLQEQQQLEKTQQQLVHFVSAVMNFRESEELEQVKSCVQQLRRPIWQKGLGAMGDMDILAKDFGIFVKENIQGIPMDICEDNWVANYFLKTLGYTITRLSLMGPSSVLSSSTQASFMSIDSDVGPFVGESAPGSSSTAIDPVFSIPPVPAFSIPAPRNPLATTTTTTTMPP
ncbi:hypothetical protein INT45_004134, partial [Circinella minor]